MNTDDTRKALEDAAWTEGVANTILQQLGPWPLATLGAQHKTAVLLRDSRGHEAPGLRFIATILPFRKDRTRSARPERMTVDVLLNGSDEYEVTVTRKSGEIHYTSTDYPVGLDPRQLAATLHALDSDGPEPLDPEILFRHI